MAGSTISWRQFVHVKFEDDALVTQVTSAFNVLDNEIAFDNYLLGNGHLFKLPEFVNEKDITVTERVLPREGEWKEIAIYKVDDSHVLIHKDNNICYIFPTTKSFAHLKEFQLVLSYRNNINLQKTETDFTIPWSFTCCLDKYIQLLSLSENDAMLNRLEVVMSPPAGCNFIGTLDDLKIQLPQNVAASPNNTISTKYNEISLVICPDSNKRPLTLLLKLSVTRPEEFARANHISQGMLIDARQRNVLEEVVFFACDLKGSSDPANREKVQIFRAKWMGCIEKLFAENLILSGKLIGDLPQLIISPKIFRENSGAKICLMLRELFQDGQKFRGGFHHGLAMATDKSSCGTHYHRGQEFNGDAINHGAKIADLKENGEGLIVSSQFLSWLSPDEPLPAPWSKKQIGDWATDLIRLEVDDLLNKLQAEKIGTATKTKTCHFADRLIQRAQDTGSRLIVGLDPDVERFPKFLRNRFATDPSDVTLENIIVEFHMAVIEATAQYAAAFKPQAAFYEQYGHAGLAALQRTLVYLRDLGLPIILDAKRNDIAHTASAYGRAWLGDKRPLTGKTNEWRVDAITINGYLGEDGVKPFLEADPHAGLFVLAKTSNPSAGEFQDLILQDGGDANFERMAKLAESWGKNTIGESGYSRIGLVVGATYPEASRLLREIAPSALFLMPGVGAQGASFDSIAMGCKADGFGAFAASSRSVLYGFDPAFANSESSWRKAVMDASEQEAKMIVIGIQEAINAR